MWENDTQFFAQAPHQRHQHHSSTPLHSWVTSCRSCGSCKNKGGHRHLRNDWGLLGVERTDCAWVEMSSQTTPTFQQFGHFRVSRKQGLIWGRMGKCNWTPAAPQSTLQEAGSSRGLADCSQVPKVRKLKQWRVAGWHLIISYCHEAVTQISRLAVQSWGFIEPDTKSSSDTWICTQKSGIEWNTEGLRWSNCL